MAFIIPASCARILGVLTIESCAKVIVSKTWWAVKTCLLATQECKESTFPFKEQVAGSVACAAVIPAGQYGNVHVLLERNK